MHHNLKGKFHFTRFEHLVAWFHLLDDTRILMPKGKHCASNDGSKDLIGRTIRRLGEFFAEQFQAFRIAAAEQQTSVLSIRPSTPLVFGREMARS